MVKSVSSCLTGKDTWTLGFKVALKECHQRFYCVLSEDISEPCYLRKTVRACFIILKIVLSLWFTNIVPILVAFNVQTWKVKNVIFHFAFYDED